jgi:hypothetical protein
MLVKYCVQQVKSNPLPPRFSSEHEKKIIPVNSKEFRFLRFRAIGNLEVAGPNGNFDAFPYEDFEDDRPGFGYRSFINKRAHVEHNSALGLEGSIGDLPDAYLNKFIYKEPLTPYSSLISSIPRLKWVDLLGKDKTPARFAVLKHPGQTMGDIEVLMRIDTKLVDSVRTSSNVKKLLDRIIRMIDTGQTLTCSMGCNTMRSVCSICGNEARFSNEYCDHIKNKKGAIVVVSANQLRDLLDSETLRPEWMKHVVASKFDLDEVLNGISNKGIACRTSEINRGLSFFELSVVAVPAYSDAIALEKFSKKFNGGREDYLKMVRNIVGDDNLLDIYSMLQHDGKVSTLCSLN